jgi:hypothetical protein
MVLLTDTLAMQANRDAEPWDWCRQPDSDVWIVNEVRRIVGFDQQYFP